MEYKKLYLDDIRTPKTDGWHIVRSFQEFTEWIEKNGVPDEISFDHDLSREHTKYYFENGGHENPPNPLDGIFVEKTGYDAAKWLCDYCWTNGIPLPKWNVHSANPVGSDNIKFLLNSFEKKLNF